MTGHAFFIPYSVNSGKFNMDFDEKLLNIAVSEKKETPTLRLYGWSPACVSLGRNQDDSHINKDFCNENNIESYAFALSDPENIYNVVMGNAAGTRMHR